MSVLSSEVVSTKDASCRPTTVSSSRVSSKAFTAKVVKVPSTPAAAGHAMPAEEPAQDVDVNKSALVKGTRKVPREECWEPRSRVLWQAKVKMFMEDVCPKIESSWAEQMKGLALKARDARAAVLHLAQEAG
eukprot:g569.t1